jgi:hypothetical protein
MWSAPYKTPLDLVCSLIPCFKKVWNIAFCSSLLLLLGSAYAQTTTHHTVSAKLPTLLQLRYAGQSGQQVNVPISAEVRQGVYDLSPKSSTLQIRSNTNWQLLASFEPVNTSLNFVAKVQESWQHLKPYLTNFVAGQKTKNWLALEVSYGLEAPLPPNGTYQGIVTYTLIHP